MFDSHVHSTFSPDSQAQMQNTLDRSIEKGLQSVCFTDHYDLDYDGNNHDLTFDIELYFQTIHSLKEKYRGTIDVRTGIELGLQPHLGEKYYKLLKNAPFDFILASIHSVDREDFYTGNFFTERTQQQAYEDYFSDMKTSISTYDHFQVLGHIDVIKRYGNYSDILPYGNYRETLREVLSLLIEKGKGIELNTSGIRYGLEAFHPSSDILKDYRELGGEIITLGSDSHVCNGTGAHFSEALELLNTLDFKYYNSFKDQEAVYHKISASI